MADLGRLVPARIRRSYLAPFGLGLLAVVVIASVGAYTHVAVSAELTNDMQDQRTTTATLPGDVVGTWISERKLATCVISGYSTVEHGSDLVVTQFLVQEHRRMPDGVTVVFTDATTILAQLETEFAGSRVQVVGSWGNIYLSDDGNQADHLYPVVRDGTPAWELGTDVVEAHLAAFENVIEFEGTPGHEVVFLYEVSFEDDAYYEQDAFEVVEGDGEVFPVRWKPLEGFTGPDADVLYPDGVLAELTSGYHE